MTTQTWTGNRISDMAGQTPIATRADSDPSVRPSRSGVRRAQGHTGPGREWHVGRGEANADLTGMDYAPLRRREAQVPA